MQQRKFVFSEGISDKFWDIAVEGDTHTVTYGRQGTAGQKQAKTFSTPAEAEASAAKLIAEKVRKGYAEAVTDGGTPTPAKVAAPAQSAPDKPVAKPATLASKPDRAEDERWIDLSPADFDRVPGRPRTVKPRPAPKPFDQVEAAKRLSHVKQPDYSFYAVSWTPANLSLTMTREEAHFWLVAMTSLTSNRTEGESQRLAERLAAQTFTGQVSLEEARSLLLGTPHTPQKQAKEFLIPLFSLLSLADVLTLARVGDDKHFNSALGANEEFLEGFLRYALPYLLPEEYAEAADRLRPIIDPEASSPYVEPHPVILGCAGYLGLHEELRRVVARWPSQAAMSFYHSYYFYYGKQQEAIFGLGDTALVESEMRRLSMPLATGDQVREWLAFTQFAALDWVRDSVTWPTDKGQQEALLKAFARVHAPQAAPFMLDLMLTSKAPGIAREWLDDNPAHAISGLVPVAAGQGKLAEAAVEFLRRMKKRGYEAQLEAAVAALPAGDAERVRASVLDAEDEGSKYEPLTDADTPPTLRDALAEAKSLKPANVAPSDLPPLVLAAAPGAAARRLNEAQTGTVLAALQVSTLDKPHALVILLKSLAETRSRDAFAWALFERWQTNAGPSKDKWQMLSLGHFGSDGVALKLTPLIKTWPGAGQHTRAVTGLDVLQTIGTDTALMQINGIAQKAPFKGIKAQAEKAMEAIAEHRSLSRPELEDRIVPDCDLDERGSRTFDFGPRQFKMVLGPDMKPMVKDADGKAKPDLPKPTAKDDPELAPAAVSEWKLLKKQVAEVAKVQAARLEQAMVTGRRWSSEEFEALLVHHPLMTNLVRLLVWGAYGADNTLSGTFRIGEDGTYASAADETYTLLPAVRVGIVHPLLLIPSSRAAWGEVLSDYELVPPFPQMGRPIYTLDAGEVEGREILRFKDVKIPPTSLVFTLEKQGWARGMPLDAGVFHEHSKIFGTAGVTAVVSYPGVPVGYMEGWDDQNIESCYFLPGRYKSDWGSWHDHTSKIPLDAVDPVVLSEVLSDLTLIAAKGKAQ